MKGKVLFVSKYGSTRQYAEWISEETGFPVVDLLKDKTPDLTDIDVVIIGGWIMADRMRSSSWIRKNMDVLLKKKVILFSTSGSKPTKELKRKYLEGSIPRELRNHADYYPLHGRFNKEELNFLDRKMIGAASKLFKDDELVKELTAGIDGLRKENLNDLLNEVRRS